MIPNFNSSGILPYGIHHCSWQELECKFACNAERSLLLDGLKAAARNLKLSGCRDLYLDGSFVTTKAVPGDFDGCWSVKGVDDQLLDPTLLDFSFERLFQKLKYKGELFPAEFEEGSSGKTWLDFFQQDKNTGLPKGILHIDLNDDIP